MRRCCWPNSRSAADGRPENVRKTIVTSLDFGLTDPAALEFWRETRNCRVLVAGAVRLEQGSLIPRTAFHSKFYIVGRPNGMLGSLVGSANLTNRGLTVNAEVGWLETQHALPERVNEAWDAAIRPAVPLTPEILETYSALRERIVVEYPAEELEPLPQPEIGPVRQYIPFADAEVDPGTCNQMWIERSR